MSKFEVDLKGDWFVSCLEMELTGFGLDLVELESTDDIVIGVGLGTFADIRVEPEEDKKDVMIASVRV